MGKSRYQTISIGGRIYFLRVAASPHAPAFGTFQRDYAATQSPASWINDLEFMPNFEWAGFAMGGGPYAYAYGEHATDYSEYRAVVLPYWLVAIASAVLPLTVLLASARRRRRKYEGLCPACGYDLRASPDRCPECGTPTAGRS